MNETDLMILEPDPKVGPKCKTCGGDLWLDSKAEEAQGSEVYCPGCKQVLWPQPKKTRRVTSDDRRAFQNRVAKRRAKKGYK